MVYVSVILATRNERALQEIWLEETLAPAHARVVEARANKNCPGSDSMLSIIVPVLNEERYIGEFLDVLGLSSQYFDEVLIVDGGSSDRTLETARKYRKVKCFTCTTDREYGARNFGASVAKGEYLLFLDADTLVYPEVFRRIYKSIRTGIDCLASTDTIVSGNFLWKMQSHGYNLVRILLARLKLRFFTTGNFILMRKDVFNSLGGFEEDINGDGRLGTKVIANKLCYAFLNCYRYVYVSGRRAKDGILSVNKYYFYAIENFFPLLNKFDFFRKKRNLFNLLWKNERL
jgi:glycosyltransferase involved in cell wall biosynthesis